MSDFEEPTRVTTVGPSKNEPSQPKGTDCIVVIYTKQPTLLGNRFGISALVVVLSVIFWGWLWGPLGMFLAVPLTMVFKVLLDNNTEFRWISVAMAQKKIRRGEVEVVRDADARPLPAWTGVGPGTRAAIVAAAAPPGARLSGWAAGRR